MIRLLTACFCALIFFAGTAEARQRHKAAYLASDQCNLTGSNSMPCEGVAPSPRGERIAKAVGFGAAQKVYTPHARVKTGREVVYYGAPSPSIGYTVGQVIGGRPSGCPHAFCGCGASLHIFGRIIPALNLAANWLRFPRAAPAPGMVAARSGHVFVLEQHIGGNVWLAHDSNSGRGLTRLHARSIAGYSIVNPHGGSA